MEARRGAAGRVKFRGFLTSLSAMAGLEPRVRGAWNGPTGFLWHDHRMDLSQTLGVTAVAESNIRSFVAGCVRQDFSRLLSTPTSGALILWCLVFQKM